MSIKLISSHHMLRSQSLFLSFLPFKCISLSNKLKHGNRKTYKLHPIISNTWPQRLCGGVKMLFHPNI